MKKLFLLPMICMFLCAVNARAQGINPMIPLMGRPLQLNFPDPLQQAIQIEQIRAMRIQNEQAQAQQRQMQEQAKAEERQRIEAREKQPQASNQSDLVIEEWLKAAAPRMGLYKDFEKMVFAPDVAITTDMIRLMTPSPLAADIAYYLSTNKLESLAISKMSLLETARSIDRIEATLKNKFLSAQP
jgi:hypothetical protein